jgi:F-type H+-transporting ATPase subunit epsilon
MAEAAAADATFKFELVSPERILVSEEAKMVVVPGGEGDFGVLAQHAPLLSTIRPGVVTVTSPSGETRRIFVAGGFADVSPTLLSVLAEEAVDVADLSRSELEEKLKNLEDDLGFAKEDPTKAALLSKDIEITKAKLAAAA